MYIITPCLLFFFFNDTATTEIYTLSLHDALPICPGRACHPSHPPPGRRRRRARSLGPSEASSRTRCRPRPCCACARSEEHTSELQSRLHLVCRLLLEKKNNYSSTGVA